MDAGYENILVIALAFLLAPSLVLSVMLRPTPFVNVLRGGEAAVCLAVAIDTARRLALIASNAQPIRYPGDVWAIVSTFALAISALLLWCRVGQAVRHRARNADTRAEWLNEARRREEQSGRSSGS